ncbi:GFA family protein [Zhongshania aliphaticivorans]|uniref:GFA family protein n=1 Tax=Zhongshania aliphaticivorans TaxID=1470434 RepID=UPI0012E67949|nr:aldehyde-activating protein [Zhongshania aliphaticivorans]CAA0107413.1 Uncharacterised protein [Zhongshania aliphaticivorans]
MSYKSLGSCPCENVNFSVTLPQALEHYRPRKCDCDFCRHHNASYLSDPNGRLDITSSVTLRASKQGSEQASFLSCPHCQALIAVVYAFPTGLKGAINTALLANPKLLQVAVDVSPKNLSRNDKRIRWNETWFTVSINGLNNFNL